MYGNVIIPNLAHNEFGITELMYLSVLIRIVTNIAVRKNASEVARLTGRVMVRDDSTGLCKTRIPGR